MRLTRQISEEKRTVGDKHPDRLILYEKPMTKQIKTSKAISGVN